MHVLLLILAINVGIFQLLSGLRTPIYLSLSMNMFSAQVDHMISSILSFTSHEGALIDLTREANFCAPELTASFKSTLISGHILMAICTAIRIISC